MKNISIPCSEQELFTSPSIDFQSNIGKLCLEGESFMDNSIDFYSQIFDIINKYFADKKNISLLFVLKLSYYNTSSSKMIFDLLKLLEEYKVKGKNINIEWHYNNDDEEIQEDIEDLLYDINIEVKHIAIEDKNNE